jgi:hypothetical protein
MFMDKQQLFCICLVSTAMFARAQTPAVHRSVTDSASGKPRTSSPVADSTTTLLRKELHDLQKRVADLSGQLFRQSLQFETLKHESAEFDPASPNTYSRLDTEAGSILIVLGTAQPYLDGYKVELQIGNPLTLTFRGFGIAATWGPRWKDGNDFGEWLKKNKEKSFDFTDDIQSARWNSVVLILPDTKPQDFGFLRVSIKVNTVSMGSTSSKLNVP